MNNTHVLKLKRSAVRRRETGHPWIFSNELEHVDTSIPAGTICTVLYPDGKPAGTGFFNPCSLISVRLLTFGAALPGNNFIEERIAAALKYRKDMGLELYCRLCFGESDGLPGLVIDRYGDVFVIEILCAGMELLKDKITDALRKLFSPRAVHYKNTHHFRDMEGLEKYEETAFGALPEETTIVENGLNYKIPMSESQKTGWYFDQRENRAFLEPFFSGRKVLDLHTYMGGFALTAARAGAKTVWGVDSSEKFVGHAAENAALNGLAGKTVFRKEKAERVLEALEAGQLPEIPDFILLDPPNIVHSKKHLPQAVKMFSKMIGAALKSLPSGGYLAVSSCSNHLSREIFTDMISKTAGRAGRKVTLLELRGQAKDHPVLVSMNSSVEYVFSRESIGIR